MFDLIVLVLGLIGTAVLAVMKLTAAIACGWLVVCMPLIVAFCLLLIVHGGGELFELFTG